MARKQIPKTIRAQPPVQHFIPTRHCGCLNQSTIGLLLEEWEALRLVDYAGQDQAEAARSMQISRQSVQMLLTSARCKLARVLVEGLPLRIIEQTETSNTITKLRKTERKAAMKIAVTTENGQVFGHFGRTPSFYIAKTEGNKIVEEQTIPAPAEGHSALVSFLVDQGVETLICGGIGGGAVNRLRAAGILIYAGASGPVKEQVQSLLSGQLSQQGDANCDHHEHKHDEEGDRHGHGHGHGHGCGEHHHDC